MTREKFIEEDDNKAHVRSKRQRTTKYFGDDFIVYFVANTPRSIVEAYASPYAKMHLILSNCTWELNK